MAKKHVVDDESGVKLDLLRSYLVYFLNIIKIFFALVKILTLLFIKTNFSKKLMIFQMLYLRLGLVLLKLLIS